MKKNRKNTESHIYVLRVLRDRSAPLQQDLNELQVRISYAKVLHHRFLNFCEDRNLVQL